MPRIKRPRRRAARYSEPMSAPGSPDLLQHALAAGRRPLPEPAGRRAARGLIVVGAIGLLGAAVLERAAGRGHHGPVHVATCGEMAVAMRGVHPFRLDAGAALAEAPVIAAGTAVIVFDRPRSRRGREDALYVPEPADLPALAAWLQRCGVRSLVVVLPHAPMGLPEAVRQGLASLDEQAVAALEWEHFVLIRPTREAVRESAAQRLQNLAHWLLAQLQFMVPQRDRPLRSAEVADFVDEVLRHLPESPAGTRVAVAQVLWLYSQSDAPDAVVRAWLRGEPLPDGQHRRERM